MTPEETSNWKAAIADATDLRLINILRKLAVDQDNREAAALVSAKAKLMGFVGNPKTGLYEVYVPPVQMHRTRGHNLLYIGWDNGNLHCTFATSRGIFKNVPEAEFDKLRKVPFPDKLFTQVIKGKYEWEKTA